jgi:hypothetical protein
MKLRPMTVVKFQDWADIPNHTRAITSMGAS